jgi:hypothetical protein
MGSLNRKTFELVASKLDSWAIYDNSADDAAPVLTSFSRFKGETI